MLCYVYFSTIKKKYMGEKTTEVYSYQAQREATTGDGAVHSTWEERLASISIREGGDLGLEGWAVDKAR